MDNELGSLCLPWSTLSTVETFIFIQMYNIYCRNMCVYIIMEWIMYSHYICMCTVWIWIHRCVFMYAYAYETYPKSSSPYDDAVLLGGILRFAKGSICCGIYMTTGTMKISLLIWQLNTSQIKKTNNCLLPNTAWFFISESTHGGLLCFSLPWYCCLRSSV